MIDVLSTNEIATLNLRIDRVDPVLTVQVNWKLRRFSSKTCVFEFEFGLVLSLFDCLKSIEIR